MSQAEVAEEVADQLGADDDTIEAENPGVADAEGKQPAYETARRQLRSSEPVEGRMPDAAPAPALRHAPPERMQR